jgi:murein DD-endopeptidase MepM/ murein hydrolase activator NlpD
MNQLPPAANIFPFELNASNTLVFDLSDQNQDPEFLAVESAKGLGQYLKALLNSHNKSYGLGGYREKRVIYKRFKHFNNEESEERCYHLGVDVWCAANTLISSPYPAQVHSFGYNDKPGDYGGTIILEHQLDHLQFFSLYGHLSFDSLKNIKVGQIVKAEELFCSLGDYHENGGWPPHLHFQVIKEIGDYRGDYPGVASASEKDGLLANCPNPELILKSGLI